MKKFFLLLAAVTISIGAMSQKAKVQSALGFIEQGSLDKAKEAIDQAMLDEKTKDWFNTYFAKGQLCQASFVSENATYQAYYADPLIEAYNAYEKGLELDPKGGLKKTIISKMVYNTLANNFAQQGYKRFEAKDFNGAFNSFETQIKVMESDKYAGGIDTTLYFNTGLAAGNAGKYEVAIKYFEKCADMKYGGITPYFQIYQNYLGLGDTVKAESILTGLNSKFPGNKAIVLQLIDLYLTNKKVDEAFKYIATAKEADPTNYRLYYVAGATYVNLGKYDEAITEITKAIELEPNNAETQYVMALAYQNKAALLSQKANDIMDQKKYNAAVDEIMALYFKALPYAEKAHELNGTDIYTMRSLQELYYRLKYKDPSYAPKYDAIKAKIDAIEKK
jgi:tetratricopeptide (TPR) repeat protein